MSRTSASLSPANSNGNGALQHAERTSDRLAALEAAIAEFQHQLDVQFARIAQMQAQLDVMAAKERER